MEIHITSERIPVHHRMCRNAKLQRNIALSLWLQMQQHGLQLSPAYSPSAVSVGFGLISAGSLLAGLYLPVEPTTGHSKNRCATSIWATLWMSSSGTSLTANVEILGFMGNSIGLAYCGGWLLELVGFVPLPQRLLLTSTRVCHPLPTLTGEAETKSPKARSSRGTAKRGRSRKGNNVKDKLDKESEEEKGLNENELEMGNGEENAINGGLEKTSNENVTNDVNKETDKKSPANLSTGDVDVPELDEAPPPTITPTHAPRPLKLRTSLSTGDGEDTDEKKEEDVEKMEDDNQLPEEFTVVEEVESDVDDVQEVPVEKMEVESVHNSKTSPQGQTLEGMTVIDEVIDESEKKDSLDDSKQNMEPDTEMVSEDELPAEVNKEPLETEAVSDEELPTSGDLPETEAVSEDELPPEGTDKKKKRRKTTPSKSKTGNR
ncbi:hypothetical protein J6590_001592 [Homalodisca vitripennis]|nr:hypothetical protein J6590_001592 [Homalodisca vitripennis]